MTGKVENSEGPPWHALPAEEVLALLESGGKGLSSDEAERRLARHGSNLLERRAPRRLFLKFLGQFNNLLIYVLIAAGLVTLALGDWLDAAVIGAVVVANATIGFIQEWRAENALEAIRDLLTPYAVVLREGHARRIPAAQLVPGDLVQISAGDKIPADLRLLSVEDLTSQEAALTGESQPVEKSSGPVEAKAPLGDRFSMAFAATLVIQGRALGVVCATGADTQVGQVSRLVAQVKDVDTPLIRQMAGLARVLTVLIVALASLTVAVGMLLYQRPLEEMYLAAVGLAVAAVPSGLPAILTITLAVGVQRMSRRKAIMRNLPAVEALGAVTVICSDKTGTITRNEMAVQRVLTPHQVHEATGAGYGPDGEITPSRGEEAAKALDLILDCAVLCNDSELRLEDGVWGVVGTPTEGALLALATKAGLDPLELRARCHRLAALPFTSQRKFMAVHCSAQEDSVGAIWVKGAPERLLERCELLPEERMRWLGQVDAMAKDGLRVIALAMRETDDKGGLSDAMLESGLRFLGLVALADPPRDEALAAIERCRQAGILVKMITGDHAETASAIGRAAGFRYEGVMTGSHLEAIEEPQHLQVRVAETDVFARTTPSDKLRIVDALQARSEIVAMTGDGVNDAPALKRADVGIAMGLAGTQVAREASDMVLADDNFATIAAAVEEGRTVYDNIKKAVVYILPTSIAEAMVIVLAIMAGQPLPISPLQILWINLITTVALDLALAFEPAEEDVMRRPPRGPKAALLDLYLLWRVLFVSLLMLAAAYWIFTTLEPLQGLEFARTATVNVIVATQACYLLNTRLLHRSLFTTRAFFGNPRIFLSLAIVLALQLLFTYWPALGGLFDSEPLPAKLWAVILGCGLAVFLAVELEKFVVRMVKT